MNHRKKLSPFGFDFERIATLLRSPNIGHPVPTGPHDNIFEETGFILLKDAIPNNLCNDIIREYEKFEAFRREKGCAVEDSDGRNYRLVNFHLLSDNLLKIALHAKAHNIASQFFGARSVVHTSLYFKHGSQQRPHIDTPFFWTAPMNMFCGVWVALEDIASDAGPLIYYPGSHKYFSTESDLRRYYERANGDIQNMFQLMEDSVKKIIKPEYAEIKQGDIFIWHPGLMHGGSKAASPDLTRHSAVFHFAPLGVNVRDDKKFLLPFFNIPKYGVIEKDGAMYARGKLPTVMI